MNVLTKKEAIRQHRKMWNWIADETIKQKRVVQKSNYFMANDIDGLKLHNMCYCCQYCAQEHHDYDKFYNNYCKNCPLVWESECNSYMCEDKTRDGKFTTQNGLFRDWCLIVENSKYEEAAALARRIANLPVRKNLTTLDITTELCDGLDEGHVSFVVQRLNEILKEDGLTLEELSDLCWKDSDAIYNRIYT